MKGDKLSPRQERFCQAYIKDLNGTKAAITAGYAEKSARIQAAQLLARPNIFARVSELKEAQAKRLQVKADDVLMELKRVALVDVTLAFDEMGALKPLHEIPEDVRRAIAGLEVAEIYGGEGPQKSVMGLNRKVRFYDKNKALELLGKHLKLFADRIEHSGPNGKPIEYEDKGKLSDEELRARIEKLQEKQDR